MTLMTRDRIEGLVMSMQSTFLDDPALDLTLQDAERRFGVDDETCRAVLGALVEANVLQNTAAGGYVRFFRTRARSRVATRVA